MEVILIFIGFVIGYVCGGKSIFDSHKKKVKEGMRPFIGKTGDMEWSDS
jgi:hypothetical protein